MGDARQKSPRLPLDGYYTPDEVAGSLTCRLVADGFWRGGSVLEPSAGKGAFIRAAGGVLSPKPERVSAVDICAERLRDARDAPATWACSDFLDFYTGADLILGNPPFNDAEAHVRHALSLRPPFGCVAFLLRLAFLESKQRLPFWREHPASKVYVLSERPSFTGGRTDSAAYGFFVWANWWKGPTQIEVVSWREAS